MLTPKGLVDVIVNEVKSEIKETKTTNLIFFKLTSKYLRKYFSLACKHLPYWRKIKIK